MSEWEPVETSDPPIHASIGLNQPIPYVLAIDAKCRMSVGYVRARYSTGELWWVFAKPIGAVTHWMPLPDPPEVNSPARETEIGNE